VTTASTVEIYGDPRLVDLSGLDRLTSVGYGVSIQADAGLTSLHGLESLTNLVQLVINNNPELDSIDALANVTSLYALTVSGNTLLPSCQAQALADRTGISFPYIYGNDDVSTCSAMPFTR